MRDRAMSVARRAAATFGAFTTGQKAMTVFAILGLTIGGYFFATWAAQPTYAPLFSNLAPADASAIVDKLAADATPYKLSNGGQTILVPEDKVYEVRIKLSGLGLPAQADTGYSLLDKQGVMTSEFMQQIGYRRAMEGELAKTIKSVNGVTAATVHLAIPQKDVFTDDKAAPTASVLVATSAGRKLTAAQVQAVVHLVASSVEGLDPEKVTVVGADGRVLSTTGDGSGAGSESRTQQTQQYEQRMGTALQQMLDQVVGPGHAVVQVTADLDYDQTETKTQKYVADPSTPPLAESRKTETYSGNGVPAGGLLGPDAGIPATGASSGAYAQETQIRNNAVGVVTETRKSAPGTVRKLAVAVLLDSRTAKGANEAQVQQLVSSAVGLDATRGDQIAVTAMAFDQTAATDAKTAIAQGQQEQQQERLYSMAKTGLTVAAVVILLLAAMLRGRRKKKQLRKLLKAEMAHLGSAEDADAIERRRAAELERGDGADRAAIEAGPADSGTTERETRQHEIAALVEQQPEEVAQLLRGWLADRRA